MTRFFHVTSSLNRESILAHGLDWKLMSAAPGIAGSRDPEQEGCFLCRDEWETEWFVKMNNTGGPVDVWAVDGIDEAELVTSPEGHSYFAGLIPAHQLTLLQRDVPPSKRDGAASHGPPVRSWRFEPREPEAT